MPELSTEVVEFALKSLKAIVVKLPVLTFFLGCQKVKEP